MVLNLMRAVQPKAIAILMMLAFLVNANASAKIESGYVKPSVKEGWVFLFSRNYKQAEIIANRLVDSNEDADGSATVLLAAIFYKYKRNKEALSLLHGHEALRSLYLENPDNKKWTDDKRLDYYGLKALTGKVRYQLGERDDSVRKDLMAGVSYDDNAPLIAMPDAQALQFVAILSLTMGHYEQAVFYWGRTLKVVKKIFSAEPDGGGEAADDFIHATEYNIACAYAKLGKIDKTLTWLKKSLIYKPEERIEFIMTDHDLDNVRKDQKFKQFISNLEKGTGGIKL